MCTNNKSILDEINELKDKVEIQQQRLEMIEQILIKHKRDDIYDC